MIELTIELTPFKLYVIFFMESHAAYAGAISSLSHSNAVLEHLYLQRYFHNILLQGTRTPDYLYNHLIPTGHDLFLTRISKNQSNPKKQSPIYAIIYELL